MNVTTVIRNLAPKRKAALAAVLVLGVCGMVLGVFVIVRSIAESQSDIRSLTVCEDNGIGAWRTILRNYADEHQGRLPDAAERERLAASYKQKSSHFDLRCDTGAPYQWNPSVLQVSVHNAVPLLWCGKPHGVTRHWRNVVFSDLKIRRMPEAQFNGLLRK